MSEAFLEIPGRDPAVLLIADHASSQVPGDVDLGVPRAVLRRHVAVDIGVDPLARSLCATLDCRGLLGGVSRLVIDYNREADSPSLIPVTSDGELISGNVDLSRDEAASRLTWFWERYHERIERLIAEARPALLVSLHSFTPRLASAPEKLRPWEVGVLYNRDDRAAKIAIPLLEAAGAVTGDNQPYSGAVLNATMNRHGEANGIAYLGLEVRQDLIGNARGVARWCGPLADVVRKVAAQLI